jgi:uncharacterized protein
LRKGIVIREQHFPGRAPVDAYGNGGFRFADMSHRGSILCLPSGIYGWPVEEGMPIDAASLEKLFADAADVEVLLIGTGTTLKPIGKELRTALREAGISADPMSTGAAVRTYNILLAEQRAVAAALIAVEG